ncbi:High mobility group superfamily [Penicillium odoratum]|uniref:High mobility group superfamily n=1 Tax=Penicillium odoratum TaxID=1167516 RepID=UPI002547F964|nr:High mobility group superfamily [Penicillium odoratum]KAJ5778002.1 High mobility group superfamily [Penicillium odoratum]
MPTSGHSDMPLTPPDEQSIERDLHETEYPSVSSHFEYAVDTQGNVIHGSSSRHPPIESVMYSTPPAYWHPSMPTSHPMFPNQKMETPPSTNDEPSDQPSPNWSPSSQRRITFRARATRSPRERRPRARRNTTRAARSPRDVPLSVSSAHLSDTVSVRNMHAWVHRSVEERHQQAETKKKVPRPMNAFMMYRSAYADRAKALSGHTNYQVVNSDIADSWGIESEEIKHYYRELAITERENHARAFPDYKFKPVRGPAVAAVPPPVSSPPNSITSGTLVDHGSPQWSDCDTLPGSFHDRSYSFSLDPIYHSRSNTPAGYPDMANGYMTLAWNSYPGQSHPTIQPSALQSGMLEAMQYHHSSPPPQELQYGISNGLNGLPGGSHHDLLQPQPSQSYSSHVEDGSLDPQMLSYDSESGISNLPPAYPAVPNPYPDWDDEPAGPYLSTLAPPPSGASTPASYSQMMVSSLPACMQRAPSWDSSHHDLTEVGEQWDGHSTSVNF